MKVKSGFATFAKNKIPLKHPTVIHVGMKVSSSLGKLLPHGFRVGERVYYVSDFGNTKYYGVVVDYEHIRLPQSSNVWANWEGSSPLLGHMPKNRVYSAGTYDL